MTGAIGLSNAGALTTDLFTARGAAGGATGADCAAGCVVVACGAGVGTTGAGEVGSG
ncbi:hypothetical protein [Jannaschia sp. 2305UL9-9]|uniref:hypothetical protein n=1 Tax=Jannaschia sp. 2305UL9-9 TaxID=3121638 RepID=UPI0035275938